MWGCQVCGRGRSRELTHLEAHLLLGGRVGVLGEPPLTKRARCIPATWPGRGRRVGCGDLGGLRGLACTAGGETDGLDSHGTDGLDSHGKTAGGREAYTRDRKGALGRSCFEMEPGRPKADVLAFAPSVVARPADFSHTLARDAERPSRNLERNMPTCGLTSLSRSHRRRTCHVAPRDSGWGGHETRGG